MLIVLGSLLVDYSLRFPDIRAPLKDLHRVTDLELGPGGATNVAITAARLGLNVSCLGEVGDDLFGSLLIDSLTSEGIDPTGIQVTAGARTPVAHVLVDKRGEPTYLGYPGTLELRKFPPAWHESLRQAEALFSDGWAEHAGVPAVKLEAFHLAQEMGMPIFFDSGPGNPGLDSAWRQEAAALATVFLATEAEAVRLTGHSDPLDAAQALLDQGPELVILKRAEAGSLLLNQTGLEIAPAYPVEARDKTGAGDSFAGAVIYGYLRGLDLPRLGALANAAGAAKVRKLGTGHNMPWPAEIRAVLDRFGMGEQDLGLPNSRRPSH
jgi:sugar/nucleoside kinase (ribokinase family)